MPAVGLMAGARFVAGLAIFGILAVLALWVWRAPALRVTDATVRGNVRWSADAIFVASGLQGRHVLAGPWQAAERRVVDLGGLREASIHFQWPGSAAIEVEETAAALVWSAPGGEFAIDEDGLAVPPVGTIPGLPRVTDRAGLVATAGDRVPPAVVVAATAFCQRLANVTYTPEYGFVGTSDRGWQVRLGVDPALADLQLAMLDAAAAQLGPDAERLEVLDLRFATRPYYRLQEGAN